jgi:hypothetical protein
MEMYQEGSCKNSAHAGIFLFVNLLNIHPIKGDCVTFHLNNV